VGHVPLTLILRIRQMSHDWGLRERLGDSRFEAMVPLAVEIHSLSLFCRD